jgi:Flp pilus assembly protein TadG
MGKAHGTGSVERGQSLVELTLLLPLILLILFGIVDLGRVFNAYIVIANASREGANYATSHPADITNIRNHVLQEAQGSGVAVDPSRVQVSSVRQSPGNAVTVTVSYPFAAVSTFMQSFFSGSTLMLQASTVMMIGE